jgi:hypothetical protein
LTTSLRLGTSLAMVPRILRLDAARHTWRAPGFMTQIGKNPLPMVLCPKPSKYQTHYGGSRVFMGHKEMMQRSAFCSCCAQFILIGLVHGQWWEISISYIGLVQSWSGYPLGYRRADLWMLLGAKGLIALVARSPTGWLPL